jgi:hypothetical protein
MLGFFLQSFSLLQCMPLLPISDFSPQWGKSECVQLCRAIGICELSLSLSFSLSLSDFYITYYIWTTILLPQNLEFPRSLLNIHKKLSSKHLWAVVSFIRNCSPSMSHVLLSTPAWTHSGQGHCQVLLSTPAWTHSGQGHCQASLDMLSVLPEGLKSHFGDIKSLPLC